MRNESETLGNEEIGVLRELIDVHLSQEILSREVEEVLDSAVVLRQHHCRLDREDFHPSFREWRDEIAARLILDENRSFEVSTEVVFAVELKPWGKRFHSVDSPWTLFYCRNPHTRTVYCDVVLH